MHFEMVTLSGRRMLGMRQRWRAGVGDTTRQAAGHVLRRLCR